MSTAALNLLAVAVGGAIGAMARFGLSGAIYRHFGSAFPYGTLGVNVIGSLLMGVLFVLISDRALPEVWRLGFTAGMLGAFTTFSTFSLDTMLLLEEGALLRALTNIVISVVLCLLAVMLGAYLTRLLSSP